LQGEIVEVLSAERKRARDAAAKRKVRIKYFARIATMGSVFLFALWLGGSAIAGVAKEAVVLLERYWQ
jgi:hypothetical protein